MSEYIPWAPDIMGDIIKKPINAAECVGHSPMNTQCMVWSAQWTV